MPSEPRRPSLQAILRTWRFAYQQQGARVLWALGALTTGLYIAAAAWLSKRVVDALIVARGTDTGITTALIFAGLYALATLVHSYVGSYYTVRLLTIRDWLVSAGDQRLMATVASRQDLTSFDVPAERDRIRLASAGGRALPTCLSDTVDAAQHLATILFVCLILARYHVALLPLVLLPPIPLFFTQMRVSANTYAALVNKSSVYRRMRYFIDQLIGSASAKEVRIYRTGPFFLQKYERATEEIFADSRARRRNAGLTLVWQGVLAALGIGGAYVYVVWLAARGQITIGGVVMYTSTVFYGGAAIRGFIQATSALTTSSLHVRSFFAYLAEEAARDDRQPLASALSAPRIGVPEWTLRHVSFTYAGQAQAAVDDVTLRIEAGEKVAIVGFNGAGKSTLMKLMLRLLQPGEGEIEFRGRPLQEWDAHAFWRTCGIVFQDFAKFKITLFDNIAIGVPGGPDAAAPALVTRAGEEAGVDEIAARAPRGYETALGKEFNQGIELSLGQWNRVALARALARQGTVLWLDEPSASLDPKSEQALFERLLACARDTTAIIISHRLAITPNVDRIIVLDHGRVIEQGTHAELMRQDGAYAEMYRTQAGMYWPTAATPSSVS